MKVVAKNITIPQTSTSKTVDISFPNGYNIVGAFFKKFSGDNDKIIEVEVLKSNGSTLIDPISIDFYAKTTNGFDASKAFPFPPKTETTTGITLRITNEALTQDYKGQFLFILEKGHSNVAGKLVPDSTIPEVCKL